MLEYPGRPTALRNESPLRLAQTVIHRGGNMPDLTNANLGVIILSVFVASIPGVVVALLSQYLEQRRENQNNRRIYLSARGLLAAEVASNRAALETFWRAI